MLTMQSVGAIRPPPTSPMEKTMQTKTYDVLRDHIGGDGKLYSPRGANNTREANPNEVAHLVPQTLREKPADEAKKDAPEKPAAKPKAEAKPKAAPAVKAETGAPENKAEKPADEAKKDA